MDDLIQAGLIGLLKSIRKWDPNMGCKLSTYCFKYVRWSIANEITRKGYGRKEYSNSFEYPGQNENGYTHQQYDFLDSYSDQQQKVIISHIINQIPIETHSKELGITVYRYRKILKEISDRSEEIYNKTPTKYV